MLSVSLVVEKPVYVFPDPNVIVLLTIFLVWSMPGGFSSGGGQGYQAFGDDIESARPPPPVRHAPQSHAPVPPAAPPAPTPAPAPTA